MGAGDGIGCEATGDGVDGVNGVKVGTGEGEAVEGTHAATQRAIAANVKVADLFLVMLFIEVP